MRTQTHAGHIVLPTTLLPTLLTDAASLLTESATSTVQDAMQAYQQAMLLLVRWYEAGQLEGRGEPTPPPSGDIPPVRATSPARAIAAVRGETTSASAARPTPDTTPTKAPPAEVCSGNLTVVSDAEPPSAPPEPEVSASGAAEPPEMEPQPANPDIAPRARSAARPLLPPSAPPLEGPPPSDALGHAARLAITRRYGADATDPGA